MDFDLETSYATAFPRNRDSCRPLDGAIFLAVAVMTTSGVPSLHYSTRAWIPIAEQRLLATASATVCGTGDSSEFRHLRQGIVVNSEPLVDVIFGVTLLHENLGAMVFAGGALIVRGAMYFSYKPEAAVRVGDALQRD